MSAQKGKDLLLKIDIDGNGTYETIAGLRSRSIAFGTETVEITHQDSSGQWRELLAGGGVRSARLSASGIFKDAASDQVMRQAFFTGDLIASEIVVPDFGALAGPFQITSLEWTGRHDNEMTFEVSLESAGALSFTAAS
ncbi:MAG: phage major tail protein, TP901-1 family [Pseudomonadota bacterium]